MTLASKAFSVGSPIHDLSWTPRGRAILKDDEERRRYLDSVGAGKCMQRGPRNRMTTEERTRKQYADYRRRKYGE